MDGKCGDCKYFHKLKYDFKVHGGFKESSCCIALTRCEDDIDNYDAFVVETTEGDTCELWCKGRNI